MVGWITVSIIMEAVAGLGWIFVSLFSRKMSLSLMVTSEDLPELEPLEWPLSFRLSKLRVLYCLGLTKNLK